MICTKCANYLPNLMRYKGFKFKLIFVNDQAVPENAPYFKKYPKVTQK